MRLNHFVTDLWENGGVAVDRELDFSESELCNSLPLLNKYEKAARLNAPENLPDFHEKTAQTALQLFYNLSQLTINRDFSSELIDQCFVQRDHFENEKSIITAWSADLIFQQLPALYKMAKNLSDGDPLCQKISELAARFPFSSVGIPVENADDDFIFESRSLTIIYLNRIIESQAVDRLRGTKTMNCLKEKLGKHSVLCQDLLEKFTKENEDEPSSIKSETK